MQKHLSPEHAETLGLQALAHLASEDDHLMAFLNLTGLGLDDLKERANDPQVLGAVLDYLMSNEEVLLTFCAAADLNPELPGMARRALPGGEEVHWT